MKHIEKIAHSQILSDTVARKISNWQKNLHIFSVQQRLVSKWLPLLMIDLSSFVQNYKLSFLASFSARLSSNSGMLNAKI